MEDKETARVVLVLTADEVFTVTERLGFEENSLLESVAAIDLEPVVTDESTATFTSSVLLALAATVDVSVQVAVELAVVQFHPVPEALVAVTPAGRVNVKVTGASRVIA